MTLRDDLIAAKALIDSGRTLTQALDDVTGDDVAHGRISVRSVALANHLNAFRPKRAGRSRPSLSEINDRGDPSELGSMFDRAILAAEASAS